MKAEKTLYISDLDGTLLNKSAQITEYTKNVLNSLISKGMYFSIATARLPEPVSNMMKDVNLNVPIVLMNGVLIYDPQKNCYIKTNRLFSDNVKTIIDSIKLFDITAFMYELNNDNLYTYHEVSKNHTPNDYIKNRIEKYGSIAPLSGLESVDSNNIIYFTLIDTRERLLPVYNQLKSLPNLNVSLYQNVYSADSWFLELFSSDSSKEKAIEFLKERYNFQRVISFGDNHNDLPMFNISDIKIAVENATNDIKDSADYICDSNVNNGVAKWLEMHADI